MVTGDNSKARPDQTLDAGQDDLFDVLGQQLILTLALLEVRGRIDEQHIIGFLASFQHQDAHRKPVEKNRLGDAYEYLIGQFAAGSGRKAGEFYTPQPNERWHTQASTWPQ